MKQNTAVLFLISCSVSVNLMSMPVKHRTAWLSYCDPAFQIQELQEKIVAYEKSLVDYQRQLRDSEKKLAESAQEVTNLTNFLLNEKHKNEQLKTQCDEIAEKCTQAYNKSKRKRPQDSSVIHMRKIIRPMILRKKTSPRNLPQSGHQG